MVDLFALDSGRKNCYVANYTQAVCLAVGKHNTREDTYPERIYHIH